MITKHQLFCMMMLFEIGSTTLFALGIKAKQDAWILILLATFFGFLLLLIYLFLQKRHPGKGIGEIILEICGPIAGFPIIILYAGYFAYSASINLRDFCELVSITQLEYTPLPAIMIIIIVPVFYLLYCGVSALAKLSEILFVFFIISVGLILVLVVMSGIFHPTFLLPVLPNGFSSLWNTDLIKTIQFPYGELVTFLALWKLTESPSKYIWASVKTIAFTGIFLVIIVIFILCTLGADYASVSVIPLFKVIRMINLKNIITNLNALAVVLIFIGGFFKICVFFFAAILTLKPIFKMSPKILILIIGTIICANTLSIRGFIQHIWSSNYVRTPYIHGIFSFILPVFLLLASIAKPKKGKKVNLSNLNNTQQ